jgi:hypothetical protein
MTSLHQMMGVVEVDGAAARDHINQIPSSFCSGNKDVAMNNGLVPQSFRNQGVNTRNIDVVCGGVGTDNHKYPLSFVVAATPAFWRCTSTPATGRPWSSTA